MFYLDQLRRWFEGNEEEISPEGYLAVQGGRLVSNLPFPLLVTNGRFQIIAANPTFRRFFRTAAEDLVGRRVADFFNERVHLLGEKGDTKGLPGISELLKIRNPKTLTGEFPKIGSRTLCLYTRQIFLNGTRNYAFLFLDVTLDREREALISRSRSELLSIFDGIQDPMVMIDRNCRIKRINSAMLKGLRGKSYEEFLGRLCYQRLHGRSERCPGCTAGSTFATGEKTSRQGLIEARENAEDFSYEITCHPLKDSEGQVRAVAESYRDLTDVIRLQEELDESERSRMVESLAAGIAHEVRNPLAVVKATAQYCQGEAADNREVQEGLRSILKGVETANRIVTSLLNFARPQKIEFQRRPLKPILEEGLRLVKGRASVQKVRVKKSISSGLPHLILDKRRFLQAYLNLLINALDAMPQGGELRVTTDVDRLKGVCRVIVRDMGDGIPEELLTEVHRPFFTTKKEGLGLGIPIAEGIVRSHGGRISFKSRQGEGTQVIINLPLKKRLAAPRQRG